jgi:hypothetical protein
MEVIGHQRIGLRQRKSPATPEIPLLFEEMSFETVCFDSFIFEQALKQTRSVCLRAT